MPNQLSLKARYRNACLERVPFNRMAPALRCMVLIREYRNMLIMAARGDDDWVAQQAESSMAYIDREFDAAREELRSAIRFNNAMETA